VKNDIEGKQMQEVKELILENSKVRYVLNINNNAVIESFYGFKDGKAELVAQSPQGVSFASCKVNAEKYEGSDIEYGYQDKPVVLHDEGPDEYTEEKKLSVGEPLPLVDFALSHFEEYSENGDSGIRVTAESKEGHRLERTVLLRGDNDYLEIENSIDFNCNVNLEYFTDNYVFKQDGKPDFTWTPQLKYDRSNISCDWTFRSPSVMVQKNSVSLALVPDLNSLYSDKNMYCTTAVDLDITAETGPVAAYGFVPSEPHYHSMFIHPVGMKKSVPKGRMKFRYFLFPCADSPEKQVYRRIVNFHWREFGHKNLLEGHNAQMKSFNLMEKECWHWIARKFWIEFDYKGQRCGGFRDYHRGLNDDIWFFSWWNCLRTAYGMEVYARRRKHRQTSEKAHAVLNLILNAPRKDGVFPAVYLMDDDGERIWTAGSPSGFGGPIDCYHTYSMSWTAYWLLKWKQDLVDDERIMPMCEEYAEFLLRNQEENGFIPSYFEEDDLSVDPDMEMNIESAEPAASALFLAEMYKVTKEKKYLDAAAKAIRYVEENIVPECKWFDFETFYSCSPKEYGYYDEITGQFAQCNMAMFMTTKTSLELYKHTGEKRHLDFGLRVLDYLSLFQQVWSHPRMELNLIGGFTTQNTDCEWSDSRQAQCAILYMDYFEATGNLEFLERGISALRATLTISPYENWSHRGFNSEPGYFSSFSWGIGTGMVSVEILWERYGDILVNPAQKWAYGINGCTVRELSVSDGIIELTVESDINYVAPLKIVFKEAEKGYCVVANGTDLGEFSAEDLKQGVEWYFNKF